LSKPRIFPSLARLLLGTAISLVSLALALRGVHLDNSLRALLQANVPLLLLAVVTVALSTLAKAVRWRLLFTPRTSRPPLTTILESLLIGQLLNIALPLRAGDVVRAYSLGQWAGESKSYALGTIAVEKMLDIWMMALLALGLVPFVAFPDWFRNSELALVLLALLFLAATIFLLRMRERALGLLDKLLSVAPARLRPRFLQSADLALESLNALHRWDVLISMWLWSIAVWSIAALTNFVAFRAMGLDLPFTAALFLLVILQAGIALPSSPGKIGVFQYLCILALSVYGLNSDLAFTYSWVLYFVVFVPISISGAFVFWWRNVQWRNLSVPVAWEAPIQNVDPQPRV
jgi:glycosyltransferase 2 family protein